MKLSFEASVLAHVALRMLADTLHRWVTLLLLIFILSVWSLKSEVWSLKSEVWSLKSEVWSLKSEVP
jgi:hypothetical protein